MLERRQQTRIGVSFPVECDMVSKQCYFYTVSRDLSSSGAKVIFNEKVPKGGNLKLNINLIDSVVSVKAKVMWCAKDRISDRYSAGLRFVDVNKPTEKAIFQFLNQIYNS